MRDIIAFYLEPSLSFMVVSLFVSVVMLMLLQDLHSRDVCLTLCWRLAHLSGSHQGKISPEITEQKCLVFA